MNKRLMVHVFVRLTGLSFAVEPQDAAKDLSIKNLDLLEFGAAFVDNAANARQLV